MTDEKKSTLQIHFDNPEALKHFKVWLCEQGEQDYWIWMEERETEEEGNITAVKFSYPNKRNEIDTVCGRLDNK